MSRWTDAEEWARLLRPEGCPICVEGRPANVIAELESSWITMGKEASALPGTCALFFRRHVIELHELTAAESAAFMRDVQRLSRALLAVTGAVKLNYEVHGNTIPHLHMHFFPRYRGDRFAGGPIDPRARPEDLESASRQRVMRQRLMEMLRAVAPPGADAEQDGG